MYAVHNNRCFAIYRRDATVDICFTVIIHWFGRLSVKKKKKKMYGKKICAYVATEEGILLIYVSKRFVSIMVMAVRVVLGTRHTISNPLNSRINPPRAATKGLRGSEVGTMKARK